MTSRKNRSNYSDFIKIFRKNMLNELFKGFWPYFSRQVISWTMWLQADTFFKNQIRKFYKIPEDDMITGWKLGLCTVLVSFATITVAMPFDSVKTYLEKHYNSIQVGKKVARVTIPQAMKDVYSKGGVLGFFVGWRLKCLTYFLTSIFATAMIEYFDHLAKKSFHDKRS